MMCAVIQTYHLGLIGWPVEHSLSPVMHKAALQAAGLNGDYSLFPIAPLPAGEAELFRLVDRMKHGDLTGLNVTIPHKQTVCAFLDNLTPAARTIGAVNTVFLNSNGQLWGDNTDWSGFRQDLANQYEGQSGLVQILGAGGAARAIVYSLMMDGWQINISSRRPDQAKQLAAEFSSAHHPVSAFPVEQFSLLPEVALIVNTTPAGMSPDIHSSPWPVDLPFPRRAFVYDLIYNPAETRLMSVARSAGLTAVNGLGMLAGQAARAFEIWTGHSIPVDVFQQAACERISL